jgi:hypothetical protein
LAGPDSTVVVGGGFIAADGRPACHIARLFPEANEGRGKWEELAGGLPALGRMAYDPEGSLYATTVLPRPGSQYGDEDVRVVVLRPGGSAWQTLGGTIGGPQSAQQVNGLAYSPQGWLVIGGTFELVGEQPNRNIAFLPVR